MEHVSVRRQLSLYVPAPAAAALETVRSALDPVQCALIPAHVTLCRDEEVAALSTQVIARSLSEIIGQPITLTFGRAISFDGHGVLLPCTTGAAEFSRLRARILGSTSTRKPAPHITLAHPRNPRSPNNHLDRALALPPKIIVAFSTVNLIEQTNGQAWRVLDTYVL